MKKEVTDLNDPHETEKMSPALPLIKTEAWRVYCLLGLGLSAMLAIFQFASRPIYAGIYNLVGGNGRAEWVYWLGAYLPIYALCTAAMLLVTCRRRKEPFPALPNAGEASARGQKLGIKNFWLLFLICYPFMIAGSLVGEGMASVLTGGTATNALTEIAFSSSPLKVLMIAFIGPLFEEFIFRRVLIDASLRFGEGPAILFSAIAFGLFHTNLFQIFYAFGIGLVFGYVYVRTRRLRYSWFMHVLINFGGSVIVPLCADKAGLREVMLNGAALDVEAVTGAGQIVWFLLLMLYVLAEYAAAILGLVLLFLMARRLLFRKTSAEIPAGRRFATVYLNVGTILFLVGGLVFTAMTLYGIGT